MPLTAIALNAALAYAALDHIDADPIGWKQDVWIQRWACGTVACFAGRVCLLSGYLPEFVDEDDEQAEEVRLLDGRTDYIADRAAALLGIKPDGGGVIGYQLFEPGNTRDDLGRIVAELFGPRPEATP